ncbi:MAG TPA: glutamyl-tRNA reductase [Candidatus Nanopelagicaceae bacterium]
MTLVLIGGSHLDLSLSNLEILERNVDLIRERFFTAETLQQGINGGVLVATCNRFEAYLDIERFHDAIDCAINIIGEVSGINAEECRGLLSVSIGASVTEHLFSVAAGLESMIVGEVEIAGQVRTAFKKAQEERTTTSQLELLFQRAAAVSKKVATSTGLGAAGRSIVTVALDLVEQRHGSLVGKRPLLLGTGAYARVVVAALQRYKCGEIGVFSSSGRAETFSQSHGTLTVERINLEEAIGNSDLIVACSGSKNHLLYSSTFSARTASMPTIPIIDVALTSDLAPDVKELHFTDVIDLEIIRLHAPGEHEEAITLAREIVRQSAEEFEKMQLSRSIDPAITLMRAHVEQLIENEVERVRSRSGNGAADEVSLSLHRVTNALLHTPSVRARSLTRTENQEEYRRAIQLLFGIDSDATDDV